MLESERRALQDEGERLRQARTAAELRTSAAETAASEAHLAQVQAEQRLVDLAALADSRAQQVAALDRDLQSQRADLTRVTAELAASLRAADDERRMATVERAKLVAHVEAVENRAHAEVDRAREDAKALKHELAAAHRDLTAATKTTDTTLRAMHVAEKRAAAAEARSQALAAQIAARAKQPTPPRRSATKVPAPTNRRRAKS
jgi:hypothetical protein